MSDILTRERLDLAARVIEHYAHASDLDARRDLLGADAPDLSAAPLYDLARDLRAQTATANLSQMLADAQAEVDRDYDHWERLACGQDTEEAEESGRLVGYAEGIKAAIDALPEPLIPLSEIVRAIGADQTDEHGIINGSAADQCAGLYELLGRYGHTVA